MSNVINFLEKMGQNAQLRHASSNELALALNHANIDPTLQAAIMRGDQGLMEELLGLSTNVCCLIAPAKEDEDGEGEDRPAQDDDEISGAVAVIRRLASSS